MNFSNSFLVALVLLMTGLGVRAEVFEGNAVSAGTAGAGRASPDASESVYLNPATLGFLRGYYFSSTYGAESQTQGMTLSITDAMKDTIVPTAIGYQRFSTRLTNNTNTLSQDFRIGTAERILADRWSVGIGVHQRNDELTTNGYSQTNGALALDGYLNRNWMIGLTWEDFFKESLAIPESLRLQSREGMALAYTYKSTLRIKMDYLTGYGDSYFKPSLLGGIENFWDRFWGFRFGAGRNFQLSQNIYSLGFGFKGPKFALQYAFIQGEDVQNEARHLIDLTLPIW